MLRTSYTPGRASGRFNCRLVVLRILTLSDPQRAQNDILQMATCDVDSSSFSTETELTHGMQQAVVCRRLPPLRSASIVEYWTTQCARRRSCLSYLRGRSDG